MKTPEEYLEEASKPFKSSVKMEDIYIPQEAAIIAIKSACNDVIDEAVRRCVNRTEGIYTEHQSDIPEESWSTGDSEYGYYYVDIKEIKKVADTFKKEIL